MRYFELSRQKNIRDLGGLVTQDGHHIKYGKIYRGGVLSRVNEEDIEIIKSWHLTDIIDFRSVLEYEERPDVHIEGITYHNFPAIKSNPNTKNNFKEDGNLIWFVNPDDSGFNHLKRQYIELVSEEIGIGAYREFFKVISKKDKVTYFHCSQGKDRAGLAAFLFEMALGVDLETAKEDYLYTNKAMAMKIDRLIDQVKDKHFYNEKYHSSLVDVFSAKLEYLESAINAINEKYGSITNFLTNTLGVDIVKLKEIYLED